MLSRRQVECQAGMKARFRMCDSTWLNWTEAHLQTHWNGFESKYSRNCAQECQFDQCMQWKQLHLRAKYLPCSPLLSAFLQVQQQMSQMHSKEWADKYTWPTIVLFVINLRLRTSAPRPRNNALCSYPLKLGKSQILKSKGPVFTQFCSKF